MSKKQRTITNFKKVTVTNEETGKLKDINVAIKKDDPETFYPTASFITYREFEGKSFLLDSKDPKRIIDSADVYYASLFVRGFEIDFMRIAGCMTLSQHMKVTTEKCDSVDRFSLLPEAIPDKSTYYLNKGIEAEQSGLLFDFIDMFTVKDELSKIRLAALIFSSFLPRHFDGKRPLFAILADTKSSGKTTMARVIAEVVQGVSGIELVGDDSDESQHGGIGNMANRYGIFDNLQYMRPRELLKITRTITDTMVKSWTFGRSHARVPNNKTYAATFNSEEAINADVLQRVVTIKMKDADIITDDQRIQIGKLIRYFINNRIKVVKEILYCIESSNMDWKAPEQQAEDLGLTLKHYQKNPEWSAVMAILIHQVFPGIKVFDFGLSDDDMELDNATSDFRHVIDGLLEDMNVDCIRISKHDLLEVFRTSESYGHEAKAVKSGKALNNHIKNYKGNLQHIKMKEVKVHGVRYWDIWNSKNLPDGMPKDYKKIYNDKNAPYYGIAPPIAKKGEIVQGVFNPEDNK